MHIIGLLVLIAGNEFDLDEIIRVQNGHLLSQSSVHIVVFYL